MLRYRMFQYSGAAATFRVPPHIPGTLRVTLVGGQGTTAGPTDSTRWLGGRGGSIRGYLDLPSRTVLTVIAGGGQDDVSVRSTAAHGPNLGGQGGPGGNHSTVGVGGGGGAASEIRLDGDRIAVAGGGGGGSTKSTLTGGLEGGTGGLGISAGSPASASGNAAGGGTLVGPGAGGAEPSPLDTNPTHGQPGSAGSGGTGGAGAAQFGEAFPANGGGGGGGGGYFGGGGGGPAYLTGSAGRSGGGSSWADTAVMLDIDNVGLHEGSGWVMFEWEGRHRRGFGFIRG